MNALKPFRPFFLIVTLILAVGLACNTVNVPTQAAPAPTTESATTSFQEHSLPAADGAHSSAADTPAELPKVDEVPSTTNEDSSTAPSSSDVVITDTPAASDEVVEPTPTEVVVCITVDDALGDTTIYVDPRKCNSDIIAFGMSRGDQKDILEYLQGQVEDGETFYLINQYIKNQDLISCVYQGNYGWCADLVILSGDGKDTILGIIELTLDTKTHVVTAVNGSDSLGGTAYGLKIEEKVKEIVYTRDIPIYMVPGSAQRFKIKIANSFSTATCVVGENINSCY